MIKKHIDLVASLAALLWAVLITFLPVLGGFSEYVTPAAAVTFSSAAFARYVSKRDSLWIDFASGLAAVTWVAVSLLVESAAVLGEVVSPEVAGLFAFAALGRFYLSMSLEESK